MYLFLSPQDDTGWKVESGLKNGVAVGWVLNIYNVWVVFSVVVVLFGFAWVVYITRKNYKPIKQIVYLIESFTSQKSGAGKDETVSSGYILTSLELMMEQTKQFQVQHTEDMILHKKYFFRTIKR